MDGNSERSGDNAKPAQAIIVPVVLIVATGGDYLSSISRSSTSTTIPSGSTATSTVTTGVFIFLNRKKMT